MTWTGRSICKPSFMRVFRSAQPYNSDCRSFADVHRSCLRGKCSGLERKSILKKLVTYTVFLLHMFCTSRVPHPHKCWCLRWPPEFPENTARQEERLRKRTATVRTTSRFCNEEGKRESKISPSGHLSFSSRSVAVNVASRETR